MILVSLICQFIYGITLEPASDIQFGGSARCTLESNLWFNSVFGGSRLYDLSYAVFWATFYMLISAADSSAGHTRIKIGSFSWISAMRIAVVLSSHMEKFTNCLKIQRVLISFSSAMPP